MNTFAFAPATLARRSRSGASRLESKTSTPLTMEQIHRAAPSIFAESRHESRSERYTYIPTSQIVQGLMKEGFQPFAVAQGGSRIEGKREFTKHVVRLRYIGSEQVRVGDSFPEILLGNSHDGTSAYTLRAGVFRWVCLNGLVVADQQVADVRIPHKGDILGQVLDGCIEVMQQLPKVAGQIESWQQLQLTNDEQQAFGRAALALRYDEPSEAPVRVDQILAARRGADVKNDLWTTFNRVQENIVRGGVHYVDRTPAGRRVRRTTREINGIDQNTALNRGLWTLASEMAKLKA